MMNINERFFIRLISTHLNNYDTPPRFDDVDYKEVYELSKLHNVVPLCANEINKLDNSYKPETETMELFSSAYNDSFIKTANCARSFANVLKQLTFSSISHLVPNGISISTYYPVPEIIGCDDVTIIINEIDMATAMSIIKDDCYFEIRSDDPKEKVFFDGNLTIHLKTEVVSLNVQSKIMYLDCFETVSTQESLTYSFKPEYALLYQIMILLLHLKTADVNIKMLTDIDVILRKFDIDFEQFNILAEEVKIKNSAKVIFALLKKWFNSPIQAEFDFEYEKKLYGMLFVSIINNSPFGINNKTSINRIPNERKKLSLRKLIKKDPISNTNSSKLRKDEYCDKMLNEMYTE